MRSPALRLAVGLACVLVSACEVMPAAEQDRAALYQAAQEALAEVEAADAALATQIRESLAYAVFPSVGKGAIGIGAAVGQGVLMEEGVLVGYCNVIQGSLGLQLGGQGYVEIVCFSTPKALSHFKRGVYSLSAQASAVALAAGAGGLSHSLDGIVVFIRDEAGLMIEAAVGMQEFHFRQQ
jgi:lipid-binding SYLF domain-containing protein